MLALRVEIRARVTLGLLLSNPNTKLCIRVRSKSNSKVRDIYLKVRVNNRARVISNPSNKANLRVRLSLRLRSRVRVRVRA